MAGGDKRIRIDDGMDRITELPVNVREHILGSLSIKDAVATSVLSSKWRYCWTGLRKLKFDKEFWGLGGDSTFLEHARVIDRILMLHSGPICEFILLIPDLRYHTMDINMWFRVLSNNGVRKIQIDPHKYKEFQIRGPFPIPSCLYHCRELEELSLCECRLTPPSDFKGFANLTTLRLDDVDISPSILGSIISGCLLLETLSLMCLDLEEPLAIEALNLKTFYCYECELENIILTDTPKLTCVSLLATGELVKTPLHITLDILCSLSKIEELTYDLILLESLSKNCPSIAPTLLENLKSLTIRSLDLCYSQDVLFILCLIRSAPNLQNMTIHLDPESEYGSESEEMIGEAAELLESEAKKYEIYNSLQTIRIGGTASVIGACGIDGMAGGDKRKRKRTEDSVDRISELPVHLREHILGYPSIDKAVATSVWSSKWRYCWTGLRKFEFGEYFWFRYGDSEHTSIIDRVLMLHSGPIREFILLIPKIRDKMVDINMWLRVLSNKDVQKIEIDAYEYEEKSYPIPSCLFHCRELKELSLCNCKHTHPSDFKGFANLTSLSLDSTDIAPSILESLISRCPLLETLSLNNSDFEKPLALKALNLKTFYFEDYWLKNIIF
ncbi:unnamed protein product [Rhodiola kirilowii]